MDKFYRLR